MRGLHERLVDQRPVRPHVPRMKEAGQAAHLGYGMRHVTIEEDATGDIWRFLADPDDRVGIERMQREPVPMLSGDVDHRALDVKSLELDVGGAAVAESIEHVGQPRHVPAAQVQLRQILPCRARNHVAKRGVVMMDDDFSVPGRVNVQLDRFGAMVQGEQESRQRILESFFWSATMTYTLQTGWSAGHSGGGAREGALRGSCHGGVLFRNPPDGKRLTVRGRQRLPYGRMTDPGRSGGDSRDAELIAQWKAGDQRAASALVERHASALARFAASCGAREDIDELVQDTFVRAFGSLDGFRGDSSFRTWLFTIERRLLMDRGRADKRRPQSMEIAEEDAATEYDALDDLVADEANVRVRVAIERLTPTQREVFVLRVTEGLSYKEIAEAVGSTEGSARVHYHNAMRAVKEFLDDA
jgi:RNA polymerase sigma-70 factor (ECF subfamily)